MPRMPIINSFQSFRFLVFMVAFFAYTLVGAQDSFMLSGKVSDTDNQELPATAVLLMPDHKGTVTSESGEFQFKELSAGKYTIRVSFLGYREHIETIVLENDMHIYIQLSVCLQTLQEVVIADNYSLRRNREESLHIEVVNDAFIKENLGGSLMQSLERLPGIGSMEIGSGQSKPVIRGLGFNRVVVVENGIKHEGQQWGADHGLEVDQFLYDRVEIIKGPAALLYGSDAMGGVISLEQVEVPRRYAQGGSIDLIAKSNNNLAGASAFAFARRKNFYFQLRGTLLDYADYRVPADSIDIYSYKAPIYKNRLRNTAGKEKNLHTVIGFQNNGTSGKILVSNVQNKQGFFANTHGLEPRRVDNALHDKSSRDIHMPFQEANHLKISGIGTIHKNSYKGRIDLGYQNNIRKEWSQYTRHGFMPPALPDYLDFPQELERQFNKSTWSGNFSASVNLNAKAELVTGMSADYQINDISGRGFIIPEYEQLNAGIFIITKYSISVNSLLQAGIRFDHGQLDVHAYNDWYPTPVTSAAGTVDSMLQRAPALKRNFSNISWSAGYNFNN